MFHFNKIKSDELARDNNGNTKIHIAVNRSCFDELKTLIKQLKDPKEALKLKNKWGDTPLHIAVRAITADGVEGIPENYFKIIQYLVDNGADLEMTNGEGETALLIAAGMYEASDSVQLLLNLGAKPNEITKEGFNALHLAAAKGCLASFQKIYTSAPDLLNTETLQNETPLLLAVMFKRYSIIEELLRHGADINAPDCCGKTAMQIAIEGDDLKIINLLSNTMPGIQENLKRRMQELEAVTGEKAKALQNELSEVKDELTLLDAQQSILQQAYQAKEEKRKAIEQFETNPNLLLYYRTIQLTLEEIFIGSKAASSELVGISEGNLGKTGKTISFFGGLIETVPVVGNALAIIPSAVEKGLNSLDEKRQHHMVKQISALATLSECQKISERVARQLTLRYQAQIERLPAESVHQIESTSKAQELEAKFKKSKKEKKEKKKKTKKIFPAQQLAEFALIWMFDALKNKKTIDPTLPLESQLLSIITMHQDLTIWKKLKKELSKINIGVLITRDYQTWQLGKVYTKVGIKTADNRLYADDSSKTNTKVYGFCNGSEEEALARGLKLISKHKEGSSVQTESSSRSGKSEMLQQGKQIVDLQRRMELLEQQLAQEKSERYRLEKALKQRSDQPEKTTKEQSRPAFFKPT